MALLAIPDSKLKIRGDRPFSVKAPKLWNDVPGPGPLTVNSFSDQTFIAQLTLISVTSAPSHFYSFYPVMSNHCVLCLSRFILVLFCN